MASFEKVPDTFSPSLRLPLEFLRAETTALFREAPAELPPRPDDPEPAPPK